MPALLQLELDVEVQVFEDGAGPVWLGCTLAPALGAALQIVPPVDGQGRLEQVVHDNEAHLQECGRQVLAELSYVLSCEGHGQGAVADQACMRLRCHECTKCLDVVAQ